MPTLEAAALDLERDQPAVAVAEDEVTLVIACTVGMITEDDARGVEHHPVVGQRLAEAPQHLPFRLALQI